MRLLVAPVILLFFALTSCSARVDGTLFQDGSAELYLDTGLEPGMAKLIATLSNYSANSVPEDDVPLLDAMAISASFGQAPGVASVILQNKDERSLGGTIQIHTVDELLHHSPPEAAAHTSAARFIRYERRSQGGQLLISLEREAGPELLSLVSPEIAEYLSALMAPIATGEVLDPQEYLDLVQMVYGETIARELQDAKIHADITVPGLIESVRGGTFSDRKASFTIDLLDILVLAKPLDYIISWK